MSNSTKTNPNDDPSTYPLLGRMMLWTDKKKNVDWIVRGLYAICTALFLADFVYYKKVYLGMEKIPGFYAMYGFFMCAALVICARGMRVFLKRDEEFYAPHDVESEEFPDDQLEKVDYNA